MSCPVILIKKTTFIYLLQISQNLIHWPFCSDIPSPHCPHLSFFVSFSGIHGFLLPPEVSSWVQIFQSITNFVLHISTHVISMAFQTCNVHLSHDMTKPTKRVCAQRRHIRCPGWSDYSLGVQVIFILPRKLCLWGGGILFSHCPSIRDVLVFL